MGRYVDFFLWKKNIVCVAFLWHRGRNIYLAWFWYVFKAWSFIKLCFGKGSYLNNCKPENDKLCEDKKVINITQICCRQSNHINKMNFFLSFTASAHLKNTLHHALACMLLRKHKLLLQQDTDDSTVIHFPY